MSPTRGPPPFATATPSLWTQPSRLAVLLKVALVEGAAGLLLHAVVSARIRAPRKKRIRAIIPLDYPHDSTPILPRRYVDRRRRHRAWLGRSPAADHRAIPETRFAD